MLEPFERSNRINVIAVPPIPSRREPPPMRRQLHLAHLLIGIGVTAVILAIGTQFGEAGVGVALIAGVVCIALALAWWFRRLWVAFAVLVVLPLTRGMLQPLFMVPRTPARRMLCAHNMKQLALALHNYHGEHGSFPPAYVTDANGKPLYSWRVLILPYVEEGILYNQFHLDEAWDSPNNLKLAQRMPSLFGCPSQSRRKRHRFLARGLAPWNSRAAIFCSIGA